MTRPLTTLIKEEVNDKKFNRLVEISRALYNKQSTLRCHHFTFIIRKGKIVSIGQNKDKTHVKNLDYNYCDRNGLDMRREVGLHSELSAVLRDGRENLSDSVFVNIRIGKDGKLKMSKACFGCRNLLNQIGYKRLYYSTNQETFEEDI